MTHSSRSLSQSLTCAYCVVLAPRCSYGHSRLRLFLFLFVLRNARRLHPKDQQWSYFSYDFSFVVSFIRVGLLWMPLGSLGLLFSDSLRELF